jgi:hypothetical protein
MFLTINQSEHHLDIYIYIYIYIYIGNILLKNIFHKKIEYFLFLKKDNVLGSQQNLLVHENNILDLGE